MDDFFQGLSPEMLNTLSGLMNNGNQMNMLSGLMNNGGQMNLLQQAMGMLQNRQSAVQEPLPTANLPRNLQILSAALPYIASGYQRPLFMALKLMEMQSFEPQALSVQAEGEEDSRMGLLNAVKPFLAPRERGQMEVLLQLMAYQNQKG